MAICGGVGLFSTARLLRCPTATARSAEKLAEGSGAMMFHKAVLGRSVQKSIAKFPNCFVSSPSVSKLKKECFLRSVRPTRARGCIMHNVFSKPFFASLTCLKASSPRAKRPWVSKSASPCKELLHGCESASAAGARTQKRTRKISPRWFWSRRWRRWDG